MHRGRQRREALQPLPGALERGRQSVVRRLRRVCRRRRGARRPRTARSRRRAPRRSRRAPRRLRGSTSSSTCPTSTEPTPSTMQWCVLVASAQRPPARPSSRVISHSGRWRSRRWEKNCEDHSDSSRSPPGAGNAAWAMWRLRSKSGSSSHAGQLSPPVCGCRQALSIAGQSPEAVRQVAAELLAGRHASVGGRVEDHDRADVHVRAVVDLLELEEGGVDWCEMLAHETPRLARSAAGT